MHRKSHTVLIISPIDNLTWKNRQTLTFMSSKHPGLQAWMCVLNFYELELCRLTVMTLITNAAVTNPMNPWRGRGRGRPGGGHLPPHSCQSRERVTPNHEKITSLARMFVPLFSMHCCTLLQIVICEVYNCANVRRRGHYTFLLYGERGQVRG